MSWRYFFDSSLPPHSLRMTGLLLVLAVASSLVAVDAAASPPTGSWSIAMTRFSPREKLAGMCQSTKLTIFAGRDTTGKLLDTWEYDIASGTWAERYTSGDITPRDTVTLNSADGDAYVFGGLDNQGEQLDELWRMDDTGRWKQMVAGGPTALWPGRRYRHQSVTLPDDSGFVVVFGASQSRFYNDVWRYTAATASWTQLHDGTTNPAPEPRFDPCCKYSSLLHGIVCFGGTNVQLSDLGDVWLFDLSSYLWRELQWQGVGPSIRRLALCSVLNGTNGINHQKFVVWSGYSAQNGSAIDGSSVWSLSLRDLVWNVHVQTGKTAPIGRDGAVFCNPDASMGPFLLGGTTIELKLQNDLWQLDPETMQFKNVLAMTQFPEARSGHNSVMVGPLMIVTFGRNRLGLLQDTWAYNTTDSKWYALSRSCPFGGRRGAAAITRGNSIWVVGGLTEHGPTADILSFDMVKYTWRKITALNPPPPTYDHGLVAHRGIIYLLGGFILENGAATTTNSFYAYEPLSRSWKTVLLSSGSDVFPPLRSFGLVQDPQDSTLWVVGGLNDVASLGRWTISFSQTYTTAVSSQDGVTGATTTANITSFEAMVKEQPSSSINRRSVIRGEAAVASLGSHVIVCGGTISDRFPALKSETCYMTSSADGVHDILDTEYQMPIQTYSSSAAYFGKTVYVFGGNLVRSSIKQSNIFISTLQKFELDVGCTAAAAGPTEGTDTTTTSNETSTAANATSSPATTTAAPTGLTPSISCASCSPGSLAPFCRPATPGTYVEYGGKAVECRAAHFSSTDGASSSSFCLPCPSGEYSAEVGQSECKPCPIGMSCRVGSTAPEPKTANKSLMTFPDQHPPEFKSDGLPFWAWFGPLLGWIILMALVIGWAFSDKIDQLYVARYYIPSDVRSELEKHFTNHLKVEQDGKSRGIHRSRALIKIANFEHPAMDLSVNQTLSEKVRDPEWCEDFFDDFEKNGTEYCHYAEFERIFCRLIEVGVLPPFEGTRMHKRIEAAHAKKQKKTPSNRGWRYASSPSAGAGASPSPGGAVMRPGNSPGRHATPPRPGAAGAALEDGELSVISDTAATSSRGVGQEVEMTPAGAGGGGGAITNNSTSAAAVSRPDGFEPLSTRFRVSMRNVDLKEDSHRNYRLGESISTQKTVMGGLCSLTSIVSILALTMFMIMLFIYDNVEETISTLPQVAIRNGDDVFSTLKVTISATGSTDPLNCIDSVSADSLGVDETGEDEAYKCANSPFTPPSSVVSEYPDLHVVTCQFIAPSTCVLRWRCHQCQLTNATTKLDFIFGSDSYSTETIVEVSADSGVRHNGKDLPSTIKQVLHPQIPGAVFKGYPPSQVRVTAVPTMWSAPKSVLSSSRLLGSGYHLSSKGNLPTNGNEAQVGDFPIETGVPIQIIFQVNTAFLVIQRFLKKDIGQLVSSILGIVSGIGVVTLVGMQLWDGFSSWKAVPEEVQQKRKQNPSCTPPDSALFPPLGATAGYGGAVPPPPPPPPPPESSVSSRQTTDVIERPLTFIVEAPRGQLEYSPTNSMRTPPKKNSSNSNIASMDDIDATTVTSPMGESGAPRRGPDVVEFEMGEVSAANTVDVAKVMEDARRQSPPTSKTTPDSASGSGTTSPQPPHPPHPSASTGTTNTTATDQMMHAHSPPGTRPTRSNITRRPVVKETKPTTVVNGANIAATSVDFASPTRVIPNNNNKPMAGGAGGLGTPPRTSTVLNNVRSPPTSSYSPPDSHVTNTTATNTTATNGIAISSPPDVPVLLEQSSSSGFGGPPMDPERTSTPTGVEEEGVSPVTPILS